MPIDITGRFGKGDINKPAIAYGSSLSGAEFDDALSVDTMVFEPIDADDFDSDFDNTRAVESTVSELQQTVGDLDTVNDEKF